MLGLLAMISLGMANDILLPHFTPSDLSDIKAAEKFEIALLAEIKKIGVPVINPKILEIENPNFTACADTPTCPKTLLKREKAGLLLVGKVGTTKSGYNVEIRYYGKNDPNPLEVKAKSVSEADFNDFIAEAAQDASVILQLMPSVTSQRTEPKQPVVAVPVKKTPEKPKKKVKTLNDDGRLKLLPKKLQQDYLASPLKVNEWMRMKRVRAGNVLVELHLGVGFGDVIRRYDTRLGFQWDGNRNNTYGIYEYDSFIAGGPAVNIGTSVGYAPLWWLELGLYGGVLIYSKELSVGWEQRTDPETLSDKQNNPYSKVFAPTTAAGGDIQPKMRFYFLPSGPVKPYVTVGGFVRIYDGYTVPDSDLANYSNRPAGVHFGSMAGAGLAFDSHSPVGVFIEVPWVYLFNSSSYERAQLNAELPGYSMEFVPDKATSSNQIVSFKVGMSLRFQ